ncbi:MAG: hypothetical protein HY862_04910 [Chloroflexi bacterium]|nr:hypothetical protein [Chloroflexota bacterium]
MLRKQHQFSAHLTGEARHEYRLHMCSLCHALGDHYGHLARLLTSGEIILLNLLTSAQTPTTSEVVMRRCPLNPTRHVRTHQDLASEFAAQAAVSLADVKIADDLADSPGPRARLAHQLTRRPALAAQHALEALGFDTATLSALMTTQALAEQSESGDPAQPSALVSAQLFAHTAVLAGTPENAEALAVIGANYGAYVYLMDAYADYPQDMTAGTFNPLRRFSVATEAGFRLVPDGQQWLLGRFEAIRAAIQAQLPHLTLYRAEATLATLLIEPLDNVIHELHQQLATAKTWHYRPWKKMDILKAALFILPAAAAAKGLTFVSVGPEFGGMAIEEELGRKRKTNRGNCSDDCDLYACSGGSQFGSYNSDAFCLSEALNGVCEGGLGLVKCGSGLDSCDGAMLDGCTDNLDCDGLDGCDVGDCT